MAYVLRKLVSMALVAVVASVVVFVLMRSVPGDPIKILAPTDASPQLIAEMTASLGLDRPIYVQYFKWVVNLARGDIGRSIVTGYPVWQEITARYPGTLYLALLSVAFAVVAGVALGLAAASYRGRLAGLLCSTTALLGVSFPDFWIGLLLIIVFALKLGWLPSAGKGTFAHMILPAMALAMYGIGVVARLTRASVVEVLSQDYVRTARAKGLAEAKVVYKHAFRNALIPVITMVGLIFAFALTRALVVEMVFAYPGMGKLLIDSILLRDYPVVQGVILLLAVTYAVVNLVVDLLYGLVDPRITIGK